MPIEINIPDSDISGFNDKAQDKLKSATTEFIADIIEESNRIESGRNTTQGSPEITSSMVNDAKVLIRRGLAIPKKNRRLRILRIAVAVLSLLVGIMYDKAKLQSGGYMLFFVLLIAATILCVTISTLKE